MATLIRRWPGWRHLPREARDTLFLLGVIGLFTTALFVTHAGMQIPAGLLGDHINIVHGHALGDAQLERFCTLGMSFTATPESEMSPMSPPASVTPIPRRPWPWCRRAAAASR